MEAWVLRPGRVADVGAVLALERATAEAPHWGDGEYLAIVSPAKQDEVIRRCVFVIEAEGGLLGFGVGSVLVADRRGEIESLAVAAGDRRKGAGRSLCAAVVEWCWEQGAERVELEVRAGSVGAIALYQELGFVKKGQRFAYYSRPVEDAVLMSLSVSTIGSGAE